MKRISIWDMDFYYKKSFLPNPKAMKISSFHKQQGDLINFITEEHHIGMLYDIFYIIKEKRTTPRPPGILIDDKRVRLIGSTFKYNDNKWDIDEVIAACRPDYMLYPEKERNSYYNANIVQFYHKGKRLLVKQPFENTLKHHKKTLVIDEEFWDASEEDMIICLNELIEYKNIAFSAPIKLKNIILNTKIKELFLQLDFSPGTIFKFQNNYGSEFEDVVVLFDFIQELKEANKEVKIGPVPIKAMLTDHWAEDIDEATQNGLKDLERCLKIVDYAKRLKIHIIIVAPERRKMESPFWYYFEMLEYWTKKMENLSYIEAMLYSSMKRLNMPWHAILNNTDKWILPNVDFLLAIMTKRRDLIEKYGYRQWGDKFLDHTLIKWEEINKYKGGFYE